LKNVVELESLSLNIKKEVYFVIDYFFSFFRMYNEIKVHNMISLMLGLRYKNLYLVFSFIGCENGVAIIEKCMIGNAYLVHS
jgi:hypothetical protein